MNALPASSQPGPEGYRRSARLLYGMTALFWLSQYAITPYINAELIRMGQNAAFMGLVAGGYGLAQMLIRVPLGMLADRMGRQKPFLVMGCLLTALAGVGYLLWYTPLSFLTLRFIAGMSSASWVSFTVLYSSYFPPEEGPRRISQLNIANQSGRLLGYVLIGALVGGLGIGAAFQVGAIVGVTALALSLLVREMPRPRGGLALRGLWEVARDRNMQVTSLLGLLTQLVAFSTYLSFANNLAVRLGATDPQLSWLNIVLVVPTVLSNILATSGRFSRVAPGRIITVGFLLAAAYCLLAPLSPNMTTLYLAQALAGVSSGFTFAMLLGQCVKDIPPDKRSAGMGFYQTVYGLGMTVGPVGMGVMIDWMGLNASFFAIGALALFSAWLTHRLMG